MNAPATTVGLRFEQVTGAGGAIVHGVPLSGPADEATAEKLRYALHDYGVLYFDFPETLSVGEFDKVVQWVGEAEDGYALTMKEQTEGVYIDSDQVPMKSARINWFHTDGSCMELPPQAAALTPFELPPVGGDTMFASMYAAWEALSPRYQNLIEGLDARHGTMRLPFLKQSPSAVHPMVCTDPVTGRKFLFVNANYTESVVGMSQQESDSLLNMLFAHINTPEFHIRRPWRLGTVAVWEERVCQHRGVADFTGPRKLRRITFKGQPPAR